MTTYIAIDRSQTAIYGLGATPEEAMADAMAPAYEELDPGQFEVRRCTAALAAQIRAEGGAIAWSALPDGTQCTVDEHDAT